MVGRDTKERSWLEVIMSKLFSRGEQARDIPAYSLPVSPSDKLGAADLRIVAQVHLAFSLAESCLTISVLLALLNDTTGVI